ncbi:hypothetical protein ASPZODRAFT_206583 [Penicilliopsis zonata CBS 506.65]|uniref:SEC7 domain-containing protein n=1 Tax=Penicilliopsis zonata CBS 506.65 TaxID=1073090 RepID=A0A1L9STL8_9EURO|nr:hypothetical protein ASPZODRAFT_206583 [Penicilliopsis zonata CBS 506.65]OJJ50550.1 hypothetical protein ASPZODRAFT_206583 [Penicilliopsis zonata CBS 506.65]
MHWKLRLGAFDGSESKRHPRLVEAQPHARHSEHLPRPAPSSSSQLALRHSESAPRSPILGDDGDDGDYNGGGGGSGGENKATVRLAVPGSRDGSVLETVTSAQQRRPRNAVADTPSLRRNRFSFMKLRHASDPQLSASYARAEQAAPPPVPALPPPTIITTAPTSIDLDQPLKRKSKINFLPRPKKSMENLSSNFNGRGSSQKSLKSRHLAQGSTDTQGSDLSMPVTRPSYEEPGRLSTTSIRSGGAGQNNNLGMTDSSHQSSATDTRFSESSRSDQSLADQTISPAPSHEDGVASSLAKRFRMPRLKRNRGPLFPLPPKSTILEDGNTPPPSSSSILRATKDSVSASASAVPSTAATATATPRSVAIGDTVDVDHVSPLPSPSRSAVALVGAGPSSQPALLRHSSSRSARSAHSVSSQRDSLVLRPGRERSSTMGSLADHNPSPRLISTRTSSSTNARKSIGDLFSISQRLRQNSEPPFPRNGSPGVGGGSATPVSKRGSLSISREAPSYPPREETDTPATYLTRLQETVPKATIASILAHSDEEFYKTALRKYMRGFLYFGDPVDMAIRKLLMEVELPKETQQIDRVLQGFADRYHECNPGIFASTDQAYFIAFSILILHTDVFNKNNKRKMQRHDYVKNTRGEGIADEILECFYENISYTPFIHIEDANFNARHLSRPRRTLFKSTSSEHLYGSSKEPVDPYTLILDGKLDSLRPSLKEVVNLEDTYSCHGTFGPPNMHTLHRAFSRSSILQIVSARSRPDAFLTPSSIDNPAGSHPGLVDIKVAKVGLLWRKDPKKKRTRSPWQEWGALLTFSQLYFFKDVNWVRTLISQAEVHQKSGRKRGVVFKPPLTDFKPDAIMSTDDAVALLDSSYRKHKHAFVFVRHNALEEVFLANSDADMNDWLAKLNYAAAFRTTGVRTQGMINTANYDVGRNRMDRMSSVMSEEDSLQSPAEKEPPSPNIDDSEVPEEFVEARKQQMYQRVQEANEKLAACQTQLDDLLRNARHLQILTPVHSRAREQVIMAAGRMSAKLKWVRQDIWRTTCYRDILQRDLGEDQSSSSSASSSGGGGGGSGGNNNEPVKSPMAVAAATVAMTTATTTQSAPPTTSTSSISEPVSSSGDTRDRVSTSATTAETPLRIMIPDISTTIDSISVPIRDTRRLSIPSSITSSDANRASWRLSADLAKERAKSCSPDRQPSVLSSTSLASRASRPTAPAAASISRTSFEEGEELVLRDAGLLGPESPSMQRQTFLPEGDALHETTSGEQGSSRVRRSLHRTLRDSYHSASSRSGRKARDSMSSITATIGQPGDEEPTTTETGEGLSRKTPSFTVHGKKASIVTFGSEWNTMSPEERLKQRKPTPSEAATSDGTTAPAPAPAAAAAATTADGTESFASSSIHGGRPPSLRSASTVARSFRHQEDTIEEPPSPPVVTGEGNEDLGNTGDHQDAVDMDHMPG